MKVYRLNWIAIALMLTGCGHTVIYDKPGATVQDFNTDKYACNRDVHQSHGFGDGIDGILARQDFFHECMAAHGWSMTVKKN